MVSAFIGDRLEGDCKGSGLWRGRGLENQYPPCIPVILQFMCRVGCELLGPSWASPVAVSASMLRLVNHFICNSIIWGYAGEGAGHISITRCYLIT
ncbi:hypothetical protein KCP76_01030 [Salmonella enterica subsp. enterica serovar Weltevreden]|nr:hypothetical protein KCP76_01030 [Salmonella enterica subsp. enterica serovar Weltevreden]